MLITATMITLSPSSSRSTSRVALSVVSLVAGKLGSRSSRGKPSRGCTSADAPLMDNTSLVSWSASPSLTMLSQPLSFRIQAWQGRRRFLGALSERSNRMSHQRSSALGSVICLTSTVYVAVGLVALGPFFDEGHFSTARRNTSFPVQALGGTLELSFCPGRAEGAANTRRIPNDPSTAEMRLGNLMGLSSKALRFKHWPAVSGWPQGTSPTRMSRIAGAMAVQG